MVMIKTMSHGNTESISHTSSINCVHACASAWKCMKKRTLETETQLGQWGMPWGEESVNTLPRVGWEGTEVERQRVTPLDKEMTWRKELSTSLPR